MVVQVGQRLPFGALRRHVHSLNDDFPWVLVIRVVLNVPNQQFILFFSVEAKSPYELDDHGMSCSVYKIVFPQF